MKLSTKLWLCALGLGVIIIFTFVLWGDFFEQLFDREECIAFFESIHTYAWAVGILLLMSDIVFPTPVTVVMMALGAVYGFALGGLICAIGSMCAGLTGYGVGRLLGHNWLERNVPSKELQRARNAFDRWGSWAIAMTRSVPILAELLAVMAGVTHMHWRPFLLSLAAGAIPTGFLFGWAGSMALDNPEYFLIFTVGLPGLLWGINLLLFRYRDSHSSSNP